MKILSPKFPNPPKYPNEKGQSLVELIVAIGIFTAIATSMTYLVVDSFSTNRQGEELTRATALMNQGYEAAVSIRNQGWDSLTTGNHGIDDTGGTWVFSGSSNDDIDGKYDRVVNVTQIDENTKKVTTTLTWEYIAGQETQIQSVAYLTSWQESGGGAPTPTPTPTLTPAPTPTPTPGPTATPTLTPTPTPASCNDYCIGLGYSEGTCRQNAGKCSDNDEVHVAGGDTYCPHTGGENVCCCGS